MEPARHYIDLLRQRCGFPIGVALIEAKRDVEQCEPGLIFWLIEELLDSQTIDGCRRVFDYLESRRERITAVSYHG